LREIYDRTTTLGSSDVSKVLGVDPFGDEWDVLLGKRGLLGPQVEKPHHARGRILEPALLKWLGEEIGMRVEPGPKITEAPTIGPEPWMSCRVDCTYFVWKGRRAKHIGEAKTVRRWTDEPGWGEDGSDQVPLRVNFQVRWQMACTAIDSAYVVAFCPMNDEVRVYFLKRDKKSEKCLVAACRAWWERHVIGNEDPPLTGSVGCGRAVSRSWPADPEKVWRDATDTEAALIQSYKTQGKAIEAAKTDRRLTGNMLKKAIGTDYGLRVDGSPAILLTNSKRGRQLRPVEVNDESTD
jgi:predicted phage-related endonuclease